MIKVQSSSDINVVSPKKKKIQCPLAERISREIEALVKILFPLKGFTKTVAMSD